MLIKCQLTSKHLMCLKDIEYISFSFSESASGLAMGLHHVFIARGSAVER